MLPAATKSLLSISELLFISAIFIFWTSGINTSDHYPPWPSFYSDFASGLAVVAATALFIVKSYLQNRSINTPAPTSVFFVLAIVAAPLIQTLLGHVRFYGDAWVSAAYLLSLATCMWLAFDQSSLYGPEAILKFISATLVLGGVGILFTQVYQILGYDYLTHWIIDTPPDRIHGNVSQPNQASSLLYMASCALIYLHTIKSVRGSLTLLLQMIFLAGIAVTASRSGWLQATLLTVGMLYLTRSGTIRIRVAIILSIYALFIILFYAWPVFIELTKKTSTRGVEEMFTPGQRLTHWAVLFDASLSKPFFGFGWNQIATAQFHSVLNLPPTGEMLGHGHNIVIDLIIYNGYPISIIICSAILLWLWHKIKYYYQTPYLIFLLLILGIGIHSSFEFPHHYLYILVPLGAIIGALEYNHRPSQVTPSVLPKNLLLLISMLTILLLGAIARDYIIIEDTFRKTRAQLLNISSSNPQEDLPNLLVLDHWEAHLRILNATPNTRPSAEALREISEVAQRFPSSLVLTRYTRALLSLGMIEAAKDMTERVCKTHDSHTCEFSRGIFQRELSRINQLP